MSPRRIITALLATTSFLSTSSAADTVEDTQCDCFLSNGTNPGYYTHHAFFDFRQLSPHAGAPSVIADAPSVAVAPPSSDFFTSDAWTAFWEVETWDNRKGASRRRSSNKSPLSNDATVYMINSASNIFIEKANRSADADDVATFLTMRTARLADFQTAAEFQTSRSDYRFLSLRMRARTIGAPGAVTAMFTYRGADNPADVQEADVEILTRGPRSVIQYTNQPSDLPGRGEITAATRNATVPSWTDWGVHRLDWTPDRSTWYVDGREAASIALQVPRDAASVNFNAWSDGGSWSGNMTVGEEARLQIQWIEMLYNTTAKGGRREIEAVRRGGSRGGCKVVCTIDDAGEVGKAALLSNSTESGAAPSTRTSAGLGGLLAFGWGAVAILYII